MIQLSLPIVVRRLSCTVPTCSVVNSRMVLRSPITSSVGSPWYFLSWLAAPIEANWKIRLSRPIVVWPSSTTWPAIVVPAATFTCGPTSVYGPTVTLGSSCALGSTIAVGWMFAIASGDGPHGAHEFRLAGDLLAHARRALEFVDARLLAHDFHVHHELVTRLHRPLEARAVDAGEVDDGIGVARGRLVGEGEQARRLCHRFEHQNARHHRAVREVAHEVRFVDRDVLQRPNGLAGVDGKHAVHQQERVAVRQFLQDLVDVHGGVHSFFSSAL